MKTRTLLLLSLGCGLAIMLAGAALLIQLTGQDDALPPLAVGDAETVGDMDVTVTAASPDESTFVVVVEIGGTADDDPADNFRLVASGRAAPLQSTTCEAIEPENTAARACILVFDDSGADGPTRLLFYERGDDRATWLLA